MEIDNKLTSFYYVCWKAFLGFSDKCGENEGTNYKQ